MKPNKPGPPQPHHLHFDPLPPPHPLPHAPGTILSPDSPNQTDPNSAPLTMAKAGSKKKWLVLIVALVIILGGGSVAALKLHKANPPNVVVTPLIKTTPNTNAPSTATLSPYQAVINKFIQAMQTNDKQTADSLESPAFQASTKATGSTTSFYDACQSAGTVCTSSFSAQYLSEASKTFSAYTASNGTQGQEALYHVGQSTAASSSTLTIGVVPSGNTWLIDLVDAGDSVNAKSTPTQ